MMTGRTGETTRMKSDWAKGEDNGEILGERTGRNAIGRANVVGNRFGSAWTGCFAKGGVFFGGIQVRDNVSHRSHQPN